MSMWIRQPECPYISTSHYAKPTFGNCYRFGKPGQRSDICHERRSVNLIEDIADEIAEDEDYGDYSETEYAQQDGD